MATVFLSYRHEGDAHRSNVRALADLLERAGVAVVLDQFAQEREFRGGGPDEGWPRWSKAQAANPEHKILIVGSPGWFQAFQQTEVPGEGMGAAAEAAVIEQRLYNVGGINADIRIVSFSRLEDHGIPIDLQRYHRFVHPGDLAQLCQWLTGIAPSAQTADDWPLKVPELSWVVADHDGVRSAFARLITSEPRARYLPIRGASGTGKSHITRQLLGNGLRCTDFACGRFDFKGIADAEAELQRFARDLNVSLLSRRTGTTGQLEHLLNALIARRRPALLIFDTFEESPPLDRWVKDSLLVALIRQKWLRVVIAGQNVPEPGGGAPWDAEASPTIVLTPPEAAHWFDFGKAFRPGLTPEKVKTAYELAAGNSALLHQLLGPQV
jgi:hypothetical protein